MGKNSYIDSITALTFYGCCLIKIEKNKCYFKLYEYPLSKLESTNPFSRTETILATDLGLCYAILRNAALTKSDTIKKCGGNALLVSPSAFLYGVPEFLYSSRENVRHVPHLPVFSQDLKDQNLNGSFFGSLIHLLSDIKSMSKFPEMKIVLAEYTTRKNAYTVFDTPLLETSLGTRLCLNNFRLEKRWREMDVNKIKSTNSSLYHSLKEILDEVESMEQEQELLRKEDPVFAIYSAFEKNTSQMEYDDKRNFIFYTALDMIHAHYKGKSDINKQYWLVSSMEVWIDYYFTKIYDDETDIDNKGQVLTVTLYDYIYRTSINSCTELYDLLSNLVSILSTYSLHYQVDQIEGLKAHWNQSPRINNHINQSLAVRQALNVCTYAVVRGMFKAFNAICVTPDALLLKSKVIEPAHHEYRASDVHILNLMAASQAFMGEPLFEVHCHDVLKCPMEVVLKAFTHIVGAIVFALSTTIKCNSLDTLEKTRFLDVKQFLSNQILRSQQKYTGISFEPFNALLTEQADSILKTEEATKTAACCHIQFDSTKESSMQRWLFSYWKLLNYGGNNVSRRLTKMGIGKISMSR